MLWTPMLPWTSDSFASLVVKFFGVVRRGFVVVRRGFVVVRGGSPVPSVASVALW
jgi:hypothetical protein